MALGTNVLSPAGASSPSACTSALSFEGVSMRFPDGTLALKEASFSVSPGEFVTVVGPSGCGKSTLLRIASGLTQQTTGSVAVDRGSVGYVFQDATLLQWRTVQGNVELMAELAGIDKPERRRQLVRGRGCSRRCRGRGGERHACAPRRAWET